MKNIAGKSIAYILAVVMIFSCVQIPVFASGNSNVNIEQGYVNKLDDKLKTELAKDGDDIEVIVMLKEKADIEKVGQTAKKAFTGENADVRKRKAVIGELEEVALLSQEDLIKYLESRKSKGDVKEFKSYYIINGVFVKATKSVIYELAKRDDVKKIFLNKKIKTIEPVAKNAKPNQFFARGEYDSIAGDEIEWSLKKIGADAVWKKLGITGQNITVGIIDSGTNYELDQLKNNFRGYEKSTGKFVTDGNYADFVDGGALAGKTDAADHGTHVAGTICGSPLIVGGKKINVIGVAPNAKFIAARAIGPRSGSEADLLSAAEWMLKPGGDAAKAPVAVNNSWGSDNSNDDWFQSMVDSWRAANIVPVFAAGNMSGGAYNFDGSIANPGNIINTFSVGAVDVNNKLGAFSRVGPSAFDSTGNKIKPDISAPGVQVRSIKANGRYESWDGTSMAAPHITGVIALMKEANPALKVEEIEKILKETATEAKDSRFKNSPNMGYGYGIVNAFDAVSRVKDNVKGGVIKGRITTKGEDIKKAQGDITAAAVSYVGRKLEVKGHFTDDVSVTKVVLKYTFDDNTWNEVLMDRISGTVKDGEYSAVIDADKIKKEGSIKIKAEAFDYGHPTEPIKTGTITVEIKKGIEPGSYANDFEQNADGWLLQGDWGLGTKINPLEPEPQTGKKYLGTKIGYASPTVQIDSYLWMPPIDISKVDKNTEHLILKHNEYVGVNGVTNCIVEVATDEKGPWTEIERKRIPPGTVPKWTKVNYNLDSFIGKSDLLHVRFNFHYPDHGEGVGWYIDDVSVVKGDDEAPDAVKGLSARLTNEGVQLFWLPSEENDVDGYTVMRAEDGADYKEIGYVRQALDALGYLDGTAVSGKTYKYRVLPTDSYKNKASEPKDFIIKYEKPENVFFANFNDNDGEMSTGTVSGNVNDWERGTPKKVANKDSILGLREAQEGLDKKQNGDVVWGTNLGKMPPDKHGLHNAKVSKGQDSYLQTKKLSIPDKDGFVLEFESYNALHYLQDYQENLMSVLISDDGGNSFHHLIPAKTIMNPDLKWRWSWMEANLDKYKGKDVIIRFNIKTTKSDILSEYDLGWYIDNIRIGKKAETLNARGINKHLSRVFVSDDILPLNHMVFGIDSNSDHTGDVIKDEERNIIKAYARGNGTAGEIPLEATVEVLESEKQVMTRAEDGTYSMTHAANKSVDKWTLRVSAYGYRPQERAITLNENQDITQDFKLEPKKQFKIKGVVSDKQGSPLKDAYVRVLQDSNYKIAKTDDQGKFEIPDIYEGEYTLRTFAKGYFAEEKDVALDTSDKDVNFNLESNDYVDSTIKYDSGRLPKDSSLLLTMKDRGIAVRFRPDKKGGLVKSADIYIEVPDSITFRKLSFGVLQHNEKGRLVEIGRFRTEEVNSTGWYNLDLSSDNIRTDRSFYVVVKQLEKAPNSLAVSLDKDSDKDSQGHKNTFLYNGAFSHISKINIVGAAMIRVNMQYPKDAKINTYDKDKDWDWIENAAPEAPGSEDDFEFDEGVCPGTSINGYIKKYKGKGGRVVIPDTIGGKQVNAIGSEAFSGYGKSSEEKITSVVIPDSVKYIGNKAFQSNRLTGIKLPAGLTEIGEMAFAYSSDYSAGGIKSVNIPEKVTKIGKGAFAASVKKITGMEGMTAIDEGTFREIADLEIDIPNVTSIHEKAFGSGSAGKYVRCFTRNGNKNNLTSVDGKYLVDPAKVSIQGIDKNTEKELLKQELIGETLQSGTTYDKSIPANKFYKIGDNVTVKAPTIANHSPMATGVDIVLKQAVNKAVFEYTNTVGAVRTPLLAGDKVIYGKTTAGATIIFGGKTYKADENGIYEISPDTPLVKGQDIAYKISDVAGNVAEVSFKVEAASDYKYAGADFAVDDHGVITRYLGNSSEVTIPQLVKNKNVKSIGAMSFYKMGLTKVSFFEGITEIGAGAFAKNDLKNIELLNTIRILGDYAFLGNKIESLALPRLTHKIGDGTFMDNNIEEFSTGEYTGHFGEKAFANNRIKSVKFKGNVEEMGEYAFANNQISELSFKTITAGDAGGGHSHVLTEIPRGAFLNNKLKEVRLPAKVVAVDDSAFYDNPVLVNLITKETGIGDSVSGEHKGHIVNGAELKINYVNESNVEISPAEVLVGDGLRERTVPDAGVYYRQGNNNVNPKTINEYDKPASFKKEMFAGKVNEHSVVYKKGGSGGSVPSPGGSGGIIYPQVPKKDDDGKKEPEVPKKEELVKKFADIPSNHWAKEQITYMLENNLMQGVGPDMFKPDEKVTRGMFVTILARYFKDEKQGYEVKFNDVSSKAYYYNAVGWGVSNGIIKGFDENTFAPDVQITREQAAVMIARCNALLKKKLPESGTIDFSDSETISGFAKDSVKMLKGANIISGKPGNRFAPKEFITRAEIAKIIYSLNRFTGQ